tara:strand:- start:2840 stop:3838 length:999 start_codon:yes stop_codon:yes gene_type:complete
MRASDTIPMIDLTRARDGSASERNGVAAQIAHAFRQSGFMIVTGHGLDADILDQAAQSARNFFALPEEAKRSLRSDLDGAFRGYIGIGDETVSYTLDEAAPPDLKESFVVGRPDIGTVPYYTEGLGRLAFAPNRWPTNLPELRRALESAYWAFEGMARDITRLCALALDLEETWFDDKFDCHCSTLRATWYPPQDAAPATGQLRAGAHTDYTAFTILRLEDVPGGLQVQMRSGEWVDVPLVPGGFVVNAGDLLSHWTNDRWLSALHRVANPPLDAGVAADRLTLVYFAVPNYDALMECIPTCTGPDAPPRYAPILAGEHRRRKIAKSMQVAE